MEIFYIRFLLVSIFTFAHFTLSAYPGIITHHLPLDTVEKNEIIPEEAFRLLLQVGHTTEAENYQGFYGELTSFLERMARRQKRYQSEERFVRYLFYKIHNKYLKQYRQQADFYELMDQGVYDCVTAASLYSLALAALNIQHSIEELPYHVYLTVETRDTQKTILLETTDNFQGFVNTQEDIAKRINSYSKPGNQDESEHYHYDFDIDHSISLKQLIGLNYFNKAVFLYNNRKIEKAGSLLSVAKNLYPGKRMDAFEALIARTHTRQIASSDR